MHKTRLRWASKSSSLVITFPIGPVKTRSSSINSDNVSTSPAIIAVRSFSSQANMSWLPALPLLIQSVAQNLRGSGPSRKAAFASIFLGNYLVLSTPSGLLRPRKRMSASGPSASDPTLPWPGPLRSPRSGPRLQIVLVFERSNVPSLHVEEVALNVRTSPVETYQDGWLIRASAARCGRTNCNQSDAFSVGRFHICTRRWRGPVSSARATDDRQDPVDRRRCRRDAR